MSQIFESTLSEWKDKEIAAINILNIVSRLRFDKGIEIVLFRNRVFDLRPSAIIDKHSISTQFIGKVISIHDSVDLLLAIEKLALQPSKIDIGNLGIDFLKERSNFENKEEFLKHFLGSYCSQENKGSESKDVILYGFGRIGRLLARRISEQTGKGDQLRLRAIVIRPKLSDRKLEIEKRMALLQLDSVHGVFHGSITVVENEEVVLINGNRVKVIFASSPDEIDYTQYGIDNAIVIDNTGAWRDDKGLAIHMRPGVNKVLLTAPGNNVPNVVFGVNHKTLDIENVDIFSAASCTTNAIVPILKVIDDNIGILNGHLETIHSYTNDQNLVDNFHKKARRGRAAATNMVLTTTGAAKAVSKVLPQLDGLLTGNAIRVPTPNVSIAILKLNVKKETSVSEVNRLLMDHSLHGDLVEQIRYSESEEFVSSHAIGVTTTSVIDAPSTIVSNDGKSILIYAWYDNEYGYTCQVVRLAKHISKVRRCTYP